MLAVMELSGKCKIELILNSILIPDKLYGSLDSMTHHVGGIVTKWLLMGGFYFIVKVTYQGWSGRSLPIFWLP